jgi:hypothetical protein
MTPISDNFGEFNKSIGLNPTIANSNSVADLINNLGVINIIFFVIGIIFMSSLLMAAVGFINSNGAPEGIAKANTRMINSLLGLAITFGAFIIVRIVLSAVGGQDIVIF